MFFTSSASSSAVALKDEIKPYISSSRTLPEITVKAVILGVILAVVMAGANAYLGLKIGITVSATIPAAVISMAILRFFRNSNILENNIVQTAASAGEVIAAAVAFTLPALLMMKYWSHFPLFITTSIVIIGGLLGVLFSIPLRRAFLIENPLKYPEGIATGEVLKAGEASSQKSAKDLLAGGLVACSVKFAQAGLMVVGESAHIWMRTSKTVVGIGNGLSLVMVAAGYIVGIEVALSMLIGNLGTWCFGVPLYGYIYGIPEAGSAQEVAVTIWNSKLRMAGVGAMIIGGLWTLVHLVKPIKNALASSFALLSHLNVAGKKNIKRTERDIPMNYVLLGIAILILPLMYIFHINLKDANLGLSIPFHWTVVSIITFAALILGFIGSAISGYMSGIVGSSNNPLSGVTIMVILSVSLMLLLLLGNHIDFVDDKIKALGAGALTVIIGAVVANSASISCDNLQDLKAGQIVGATPWKQQVMLMLGVIAGAIAITPILDILFKAYGIGNTFPRAGMDPTQALAAPKAALMAALTEGVFARSLDWSMVFIGFGIAIGVILIDEIMRRRNSRWRFPVLAVAIGIYMPLDVVVPLFFGGVIAFIAEKRLDRQRSKLGADYTSSAKSAQQRGVLFCSGLIAGEAMVGILLAIPFAAYQSTSLFSIAPQGFAPVALILGNVIFFGVGYYLLHISSKTTR